MSFPQRVIRRGGDEEPPPRKPNYKVLITSYCSKSGSIDTQVVVAWSPQEADEMVKSIEEHNKWIIRVGEDPDAMIIGISSEMGIVKKALTEPTPIVGRRIRKDVAEEELE